MGRKKDAEDDEEEEEEEAAAADTTAQRSRKVSKVGPTPTDVLRHCVSGTTSFFSNLMKDEGFKQKQFGAIVIATLTQGGAAPVHAATSEFVNLRDSADLQLLLQKWYTHPASLTPAGSMSTQQQGAWLCLMVLITYC